MNENDRFKTIEYKCPHCQETVEVERPDDLRNCLCNRFKWIRTDYFLGEKFVPKKLADELMTEYHIVTPANMPIPFYYHEDQGYYRRAKHHLEQQIDIRLKHDSGTRRTGETIAYIQHITYTHNHDEPEPTLINLANGSYDIEDNELLEHNPINFFLNCIPINYEPSAECPRVHTFLREVTDSEQDALALEEFAGYCLYRAMPKHRAFLLIGEGANGKSTYLGLLQGLLGKDNYASVPLQDLITRPFLRARLYGKLANVFADLPNSALQSGGTGIFKALTGNDAVDAEIKFVQDPVNFVNHAKLIFSCNQIPRSEDDSLAFWRRWTLISFPHQFTDENRDADLPAKLALELPGFLNLALNGLKRLRNNRWKFSNEQSEDETRKQYLKHSDSFQYFVETCVEVTYEPDDFISKDDFYAAYCAYVRSEKLGFPEPKGKVSKRLYELIPGIQHERKRTLDKGRVMVWTGIKMLVLREKAPSQSKSTLREYGNTPTSDNQGVEAKQEVGAHHNSIESRTNWTADHSVTDTSFSFLEDDKYIKKVGKTLDHLSTLSIPLGEGNNPNEKQKEGDLGLAANIKTLFRRQGPELSHDYIRNYFELLSYPADKIDGTLGGLVNSGQLTRPKAGYFKATEEYLR